MYEMRRTNKDKKNALLEHLGSSRRMRESLYLSHFIYYYVFHIMKWFRLFVELFGICMCSRFSLCSFGWMVGQRLEKPCVFFFGRKVIENWAWAIKSQIQRRGWDRLYFDSSVCHLILIKTKKKYNYKIQCQTWFFDVVVARHITSKWLVKSSSCFVHSDDNGIIIGIFVWWLTSTEHVSSKH